ncbi:hypothetical protein CRUP_011932 [Coryphaenoides rupestris]|nr:hypothetical protein CRUP_011932 [Coryphaenoides rupestris]
MFRFPPVPVDRASRVLRPGGGLSGGGGGGGDVPVVARRAGGHDAPENTLAAIREGVLWVQPGVLWVQQGVLWVQRGVLWVQHPLDVAAALAEMYQRFPALYNSSVMRQADPRVVTALTHRPWSLSRHSDGTPHTLSSWGQFWSEVLDVLLDWAHHHLLWDLCGVSAILIQKDFISL